MSNNFNKLTELSAMIQHVLPLTVDNSLSYYELVSKILKKVNELIENQNTMPDYIQETIQKYISDGNIGVVVNNILSTFLLNVVNPPNNLKPADNTGASESTEAFQGCIDFAYKNGGGCIYVPSGTYLCGALQLKDNVTIYGFDRATTTITLKGGIPSDKALLYGTTKNNSILNLTFNGNSDIQVNNVDLFKADCTDLKLHNVNFVDGYNMVNLTLHGVNQISEIIFGDSVVDCLKLDGDGVVTINNIYIDCLSELKGRYAINFAMSNSTIDNAIINTGSTTAIYMTGNNNMVNVLFTKDTSYKDEGINNFIHVIGESQKFANENVHINNLYLSSTERLNEFFNAVNVKSYDGKTTYKMLVEGATNLETAISDIITSINNLNNDVDQETNNRIQEIETIRESLQKETQDRQQAITEVTESIQNESQQRQTAISEVTHSIQNESQQRQTAISEVNESLQNEAQIREQADNQLEAGISNSRNELVNMINSESTQRQEDIHNIQEHLNNFTSYPILDNEIINGVSVVVNIGYPYGHAKRYGVIADGKTDTGPFFTNAVSTGFDIYVPSGTYFIHTPIRIPQKGRISLYGDIGNKPRFIGDNTVVISRTPSPDGANTVNYVYLHNLVFDGQNKRTTFMHKQGNSSGRGFSTTFSLGSVIGEDTSMIIDSCEFLNINSLPFVVDNFRNVRITNNYFYKTMDAGLRTCENILYSNNIVEFSADNGISISRGCQIANITNNIFRNCEVNAIYITGYELERTRYQTLTITGYSYNFMSEVALSLSSAYNGMIRGQFITVYDSDNNYGIIKITDITPDNKNATGIVVKDIPNSIQNTTAKKWFIAPLNAPRYINVSNNLCINCYGDGLALNDGAKNCIISNNQFINAGICCDSEISYKGSIARGTNSLIISELPEKLSEGDFIMIMGENSYTDIFMSKISHINNYTLTLESSPSSSFANERVYLLHVKDSSGGCGIDISGYSVGDKKLGYNLKITNNFINGYYENAIKIGNAKCSCTDIFIENNVIKEYDTNVITYLSNRYVINCQDDSDHHLNNLFIKGNYYDGTFPFIFISQITEMIRNFVIKDNNVPNTSRYLLVRHGSTHDITHKYQISYNDGTKDNVSYDTKVVDIMAVSTSLSIKNNVTVLTGDGATVSNISVPSTNNAFSFTLINSCTGNVTLQNILFADNTEVVIEPNKVLQLISYDNKLYNVTNTTVVQQETPLDSQTE